MMDKGEKQKNKNVRKKWWENIQKMTRTLTI
jgi:hypothetical protein